MKNVDFNYFIFSSFWMYMFDIPSQRKLIDSLNGIDFIIHPNEKGHSGHVHAKYQNSEAVISISECKYLKGNIPPKKQREAEKWVRDNKELLIQQWNELTNGIKIPII